MEILSKLIKESSKRLQVENLCGLKLNDYQIEVLMNDCNEKIIEYKKQPRRYGKTTAMLLKVIKDILIDNKNENVMILSDSNLMSIAAKSMFDSLLKQADLDQLLQKSNRYECITKNNVVIKFSTKNLHNLLGVNGFNFYIDDYNANRDVELLNACGYSFPQKIYLF